VGVPQVSRLLSVTHALGTTTVDGASYTYDNAGNRKTRTDLRTGTALTYGYDNIYQLLSAKQGTTTKESYTYDLVGNRLTSLGVSPYVYNTSNELQSTPTLSYTYDNNGNIKTKSNGTQYTWDPENRLSQVTLPGSGGTVTFKYDPFGRRIQKSFTNSGGTTNTNYVYDSVNLLEEVDNSGNVLARYTQSGAVDEPLAMLRSGTTSYYEQDGLGSISSLSNSAGALANTYSYDSYGNLTASSGTTTNPFRYTGRESDQESGIYEYRARYYDQAVGRFLSEDPMRFISGLNEYSYVHNRPTLHNDPLGLCPPDDRERGTHACYNAFINGTIAGRIVGYESDGPSNFPGVNDHGGPLAIITIVSLPVGQLAGRYFLQIKPYTAFLVPLAVAATIVDILELEGCAVTQSLVPDTVVPPGVNPNDPNDPCNWF
jgi:RHS repeat-associated protein